MTQTKFIRDRQQLKGVDAAAFGAEITRRYLAKGWTRHRFRTHADLSVAMLYQYEIGLCKPRLPLAYWIARCLDTTVRDIIAGANAAYKAGCIPVADKNRFGMRLRIHRKLNGLTTQELADKARLPYYIINRCERGFRARQITPAVVQQLAHILGVSAEILTRPVEKPITP